VLTDPNQSASKKPAAQVAHGKNSKAQAKQRASAEAMLWARDQGPLTLEAVEELSGRARLGHGGCWAQMLARRYGECLPPARLKAMLEEWAAAAAFLEPVEVQGDAKRQLEMGRLTMDPFAQAWGSATRQEAEAAAWAQDGPAVIKAAWELSRVLSGASLGSIESEAAMGLARAVEKAARGRDENDSDGVVGWLAFGADVNAKASWPEGSVALSALERAVAENPGAWRLAARIAKAGGLAGMERSWGAARQTMNCCVCEGSGRPARAEASERVGALLAILGGLGASADSFRGKNGSRFDEFAMSCLWGNPSREMARELAQSCGGWTSKAQARLPSLASQALKHRLDDDCLGALESISASRGLGPWRASWTDVAKAAKAAKTTWLVGGDSRSKEERWGEAFGRWIEREGWGSQGFRALDAAWPELAKSPAMRSAKESADLSDALGVFSEPAAPKAHKPRTL
jgi:hypothetical protein